MENTKELPVGWAEASMEDVCQKISNGGNFNQKESAIGLPVTRIETISFEEIDFNRVKYCSEYLESDVEKYKLHYGDILFSHINSDLHLGKTAIFKEKKKTVLHGINLLKIQTNEIISPFFLNLIFKHLRYKGEFIKIAHKAVNQSSINQAKLKQIVMPLPPLPEQHRIVAKIEELFSELDKGVENLKIAQQQLRVYRQAVLKWAFEGKLTNSTLKGIRLLGELIEEPRYGTSKKCTYEKKGKACLRIPNILNNFIDKNDLKYAEFNDKEIDSLKLKVGDILIIRSNGSVSIVGKAALVRETDTDFIFAGYLIRIRLSDNCINPKYLLYHLLSPQGRDYIEAKAKSTSGVNNINSDEIKGLEVPLYNIEEQNSIVSEIEARLSVCDKMEESIEQSLIQAEALRQSILKKAFEGRLIPQNPKDEPAEKLLQRIRQNQDSQDSRIKKIKK